VYSQITNGLSALRIPNRFDLGGSPAMAQFLFCLEPFRWQETFFRVQLGTRARRFTSKCTVRVTLSVLVFLHFFLLQFALQI
jgi:hypothetical protein